MSSDNKRKGFFERLWDFITSIFKGRGTSVSHSSPAVPHEQDEQEKDTPEQNDKSREEKLKQKEAEENVKLVEDYIKEESLKQKEAEENVKFVENYIKEESLKQKEAEENVKLVEDYIKSGKQEAMPKIRNQKNYAKEQEFYDPSKPMTKKNAPEEIPEKALWRDTELQKTMEQTDKVPDDGSCFYHSVIRNGNLGERFPTALDLRNHTANWLIDNENNPKLQQFLSDMGVTHEAALAVVCDGWMGNAGDIAPTIVSSALGIQINVHRPPSKGNIQHLESLTATKGSPIDVYQCDNHYEANKKYYDAYHELSGNMSPQQREKESEALIKEMGWDLEDNLSRKSSPEMNSK